jgi:hypothetical protein
MNTNFWGLHLGLIEFGGNLDVLQRRNQEPNRVRHTGWVGFFSFFFSFFFWAFLRAVLLTLTTLLLLYQVTADLQWRQVGYHYHDIRWLRLDF